MLQKVPSERIRNITRRTFLQMIGWVWVIPAAIALRQFLRFVGYQPPGPDPTVIALGIPQSFPALPVHLEQARLFLQKDEGGYFALDNVCTHLGCLIHPQPDGSFACPCHGSLYTANGQLLRGPATRSLPYLKLQWDSTGQIVVNRSEQVTAAFRLPNP